MEKQISFVSGYYLDYWEKYGLSIPVKLGVGSHPHILICGASGSGKSLTLLFLLGKLLQAFPGIQLYLCDFKNSEDFAFLNGYDHYYAGDSCFSGLMDYYACFSEVRQTGNTGKRFLLIFDEYPAFISHMQLKDKREKTKLANDALGAIAEILMLGRGIGFGCWIVTQRADSTLFSHGARDNFMAVLGCGNLSKEQKGMVFPGQEIPDRVFRAGEGMLHADGKEITAVKYPLIQNVADWKKHIFDILAENCSTADSDW